MENSTQQSQRVQLWLLWDVNCAAVAQIPAGPWGPGRPPLAPMERGRGRAQPVGPDRGKFPAVDIVEIDRWASYHPNTTAKSPLHVHVPPGRARGLFFGELEGSHRPSTTEGAGGIWVSRPPKRVRHGRGGGACRGSPKPWRRKPAGPTAPSSPIIPTKTSAGAPGRVLWVGGWVDDNSPKAAAAWVDRLALDFSGQGPPSHLPWPPHSPSQLNRRPPAHTTIPILPQAKGPSCVPAAALPSTRPTPPSDDQ